MYEQENILKKIKIKILNNDEMSNSEIEIIKLNADSFKDIRFIRKRKVKRKCLKE